MAIVTIFRSVRLRNDEVTSVCSRDTLVITVRVGLLFCPLSVFSVFCTHLLTFLLCIDAHGRKKVLTRCDPSVLDSLAFRTIIQINFQSLISCWTCVVFCSNSRKWTKAINVVFNLFIHSFCPCTFIGNTEVQHGTSHWEAFGLSQR